MIVRIIYDEMKRRVNGITNSSLQNFPLAILDPSAHPEISS
jgi:hypothetical protein